MKKFFITLFTILKAPGDTFELSSKRMAGITALVCAVSYTFLVTSPQVAIIIAFLSFAAACFGIAAFTNS